MSIAGAPACEARLISDQKCGCGASIPHQSAPSATYWHAVALVNMNRADVSLPLFAKAFGLEPGWRDLTPRLPRSGLLPDDAKLIERIVAAKQ